MPVTWLLEHGGPVIRYRLATEVFPGLLDQEQLAQLQVDIEHLGTVRQIIKKQKDTGVWGGNVLGVTPNKTTGVKDVGTIPQFRRLLEFGVSRDNRAVRLGARLLFRLVSRDPDPKLLFEYAKYGDAEPGDEPWIREYLREAAAAALAHAGLGDDPRVRGAAHKILNEVSAFIRSEDAANPFVKSGKAWVLRPDAYPPTFASVTLLALLPAVQRERAGLVERLGAYLNQAPTKKSFTVMAGKKSLKPDFLLLGDPIHVGATGAPDDMPLALHWMELLARLGLLSTSVSAAKVWSRLMKDTDEQGVWHPRNLRAAPRTDSPWAFHVLNIDADSKRTESRQTDVTFRMALIARHAGLELSRT